MPASVRQAVNDFVDEHPVRFGRVLQVAGILLGVRPLDAVTHVGIPVRKDQRAAAVVENRTQTGHEPTLLPRASGKERPETWRLRIAGDVVKGRKNRVWRLEIDDLAIRKDAPHLAGEV